MTDPKCEIVSKSLLKRSSDLPPEELKKFCLGLPDWCPCCIIDRGMAETNENCDDSTVAHGKSLTLKWNCTKNPTAVKKVKETSERFFFNVSANQLADFKKESPQKILLEDRVRL